MSDKINDDAYDDICVVGATLEDVEKSKILVAELMKTIRQRLSDKSENPLNKSVDLTDDKT